MVWVGNAAWSVAHTSCSLSRSTSVTMSTALLWRTSRMESTRRRRSAPADRAAWMPTSRARRTSNSMVGSAVCDEVQISRLDNAAVRRSALKPSGRGRRDVFRRTQHDRALIARGLAQVPGHACLGIGQARHREPRLMFIQHAQALERADIDAVAAAAADLLLFHGPCAFGAANLFGRIAIGIEDRIVRTRAPTCATVDADLGIDEVELLLYAVDRGDGAHGLTRRAAHAFVVDEISHRMSPQFSIQGASLSFPLMPLGAHVSTAGGL